MKNRRGFTMVEILVVIGIIAILAAILFPVLASARARAKQTACESRLYQLGHGIELFEQEHERYPQSASDVDEIAKGDVSHCPYPSMDTTDYVYVLPNTRSPEGSSVVAYCVQHLKRGDTTMFKVPLEGKIPVLRFPSSASVVDAKGVERWTRGSSGWVKVDETGDVPTYPTIWKFPGDSLPP